MFTRRHLLALAVCILGTSSAFGTIAESPNLGIPATPEQIAGWDTSIGPDGIGLPAGSGTAIDGEVVYNNTCSACHGEKGVGKPNDRLVGGQGTLVEDQVPVKTIGSYWPYASTLFDYTRRAMPWNAPKSLTNDEVYAVTAYILHLNGIVRDSDKIDAQTLPNVKMPNRDGFIAIYPKEP